MCFFLLKACTLPRASRYHQVCSTRTNCTHSLSISTIVPLVLTQIVWYFRKITVPYPVHVPSPTISYSAPVVVGHGLYDHHHSYGGHSYGHGLYSSYKSPYYHSSGVKVISSPIFKSYGYHGGYHSSGYHGGYHGYHSGGLGISIGSKYSWPLKFGLKYHGWWFSQSTISFVPYRYTNSI